MTLQSSGPIKFSEIANEFGYTPNYKLGEYRVNDSIAGKTWPLDTGVPSSGQIKFSDFYSKRLNIVIDSGTGSDEFNVTLTNYWNTKTKRCVGGFKSPEASLVTQGTKKYHTVLRRDYGGSGSVNTSVKSGNWPSGCILNVYVDAAVFGRGGGGGNGAQGGLYSQGGSGSPGLNAIGFSYDATLNVTAGASIIAGFGGGGGGGGGYSNPDEGSFDPGFGGGGGGGGQGNPGGSGGPGGGGAGGGAGGSSGSTGSKTSGGNGGSPGCFPQINGKGGGGGGGGGNPGGNAPGCQGGGWGAGSAGTISGGGSGAGGNSGGGGGGGAGNGNAILRTSGITLTVNNGGYCYPSATPVVNDSFN